MITLYEGITTTSSPATFTSMPYPLVDAIDCTVTEERNGQFSLVMRYPIGGTYWTKIIPDAIIMADPRPNADPEPFRIYEIEQVIDGVVTARANHIVYDLDGIGPVSIAAITENWTNLDDFISSVNTNWFQYLNRCFRLENDGLTSTSSIPQGTGVMQTLWSVIGYVANAFNAELKYEWVNGVCVITFCAARGVQKPTVISYGVNLVGLDRKLYTGDLYSSVCAYYSKDNDLVYGYANTSYTARERILFVNVTDKFASVPTQEEIDAEAANYVATHDFNPSSDLSVDFVPMENTTEYSVPSVPALSDGTPYAYRPSGGSLALGIRNRETDSLIGGTVAWNQICDNDFVNHYAKTGSPTVTKSGDTTTITVGDANALVYLKGAYRSLFAQIGHKLLVFFKGYDATNKGNSKVKFSFVSSATTGSTRDYEFQSDSFIYSSIADVYGFGIYFTNVTSGDSVSFDGVSVINLTAMFGSTIADYVYTLESGTAGAGIAWLKRYGFFSNNYYPYHATTLESVNTSAHVMRDSSDSIIGNYPLDPDLQLRGILKKDASNNLYYDGDTYAADGTVMRKYGTMTLDGVTSGRKFTGAWGSTNNGYAVYWSGVLNKRTDVICDRFVYSSLGYSTAPLYSFVGGSGSLTTWTFVLPSTVTTLAEANQWLESNPTTFVYNLATPTAETADAYTNPQVVDSSGTEQYVDAAYTAGTRDFEMPVGHYTEYTFAPEDTALYLCDTATVDASLIGVTATAKCVKVIYNVLTDKYDKVTVGTVQADIVDTILKLGE